MSSNCKIAAALALALGATAAKAADINDTFSIRSYGTIGVVHSSEDQADYVSSNLMQPEGAGYSNSWSTDVDSKLALQLDAAFTERFSAVVQLVSEGVYNNSWDGDANKRYTPSLEWANVSYKLTDELTVRAGRSVLPFLMDAEFRKVGYVRHWVRAPIEVYGTMPFNSTDGADVTYRTRAGSGFNTARAHYGVQSMRSEDIKAQVKMWGVSDTFEIGGFTVRAAYLNTTWETPGEGFGPLFEGFAAVAGMFPSGQAAAAEALRLEAMLNPANPQKMDSYTVGVSYDPGQWFAQSELARTESDGLLGSSTYGYATGGYRFGAFTPYATYSRLSSKERSESISLAGLPPAALGLGMAVNSVVNGVVGIDGSQQSLALGMRWDFRSNFALKAQYDRVDLDSGSNGLLANHQTGFEAGSNMNVFSLAVDYVF